MTTMNQHTEKLIAKSGKKVFSMYLSTILNTSNVSEFIVANIHFLGRLRIGLRVSLCILLFSSLT